MKIEKGKLKLIVEVLSDVKVSLSQGRVRDEFIRSVSEHIETLNKDNNKILERFCKKDSKGNPITVAAPQGGTTYSFSPANMKKL